MSNQVNQIIYVFYRDSKGYHPALVTGQFKLKEDQKAPDVSLCVFVTGYHSPCFDVPRVSHGDKVNQYLLPSEMEDEEEEVEVEPAEVAVVDIDLTKPVETKQAEAKVAKEPKPKKEPKEKAPDMVKEPDAEQGKAQQDEATGEVKSEPSA